MTTVTITEQNQTVEITLDNTVVVTETNNAVSIAQHNDVVVSEVLNTVNISGSIETVTIDNDVVNIVDAGSQGPQGIQGIQGIQGASSSPAGSNGQLQFNNNGAFGADSNLFWDNSSKALGIGTVSPDAPIHTVLDSSSSGQVDGLVLERTKTGTPSVDGIAILFQGETSTTLGQEQAEIVGAWGDATHATRSGILAFLVADVGVQAERLRMTVSEVHFNILGNDIDFFVGSDQNQKQFSVDAGTDEIRMGQPTTLGSMVSIFGFSDKPQLIIRGAATQTTDIFKIQSSGGAEILSVSDSGAITIDGALNHDGSTVGFYGTTPAVQSSAYTRDATIVEDRTLLASASATILNNNNVLAALIADLQVIGLLG